MTATPELAAARRSAVRQGILLSYATIGYNSLEAIGSLIAGLLSGSVALGGFGIDSVIEVIALGGVGLNALFGWWWADPIAALAMVPIIVREGIHGLRPQPNEADACC